MEIFIYIALCIAISVAIGCDKIGFYYDWTQETLRSFVPAMANIFANPNDNNIPKDDIWFQ